MLEVKCYSGHKGEEKPLKIILDNQEHFVESILRKELIEDFKTRERKTIFWCQTKDNIYKLIRFANGNWELAKEKEIKVSPRNAKLHSSKTKEYHEGTKIHEITEKKKRNGLIRHSEKQARNHKRGK